MKKWFGFTALTALLAGVIWVTNFIWFKPFNVNRFYDRVFAQFVLDQPEMLSQIHLLEQFGITFHQDDLDDESVAREDKRAAMLKETLQTLERYDRSQLNYQQALSYDVFQWSMNNMQKSMDRWRYYGYPVNQLFGLQNNFPSFMESTHQVTSKTEATDYITRLSKVGIKFDQVMEGLKIREDKNIIPPSFVIEKVLTEMQDFVETKPEDSILYQSLATKMIKAGKFSDEQQATYLNQAKDQIVQTVYPAYQKYITYFTQLKTKSTADAGVWKFPDGDQYYADMIESQTTLKIEPNTLHQLGLSEVERIQGEMRAILQSEGYDTSRPVGELMSKLGEEPRFLYPDTDEGRQQILVDYQKIIDEISAGLKPYFAVEPRAPVKVERIPVFKEKTAPGAYYNGPAMDGSRPGVFYANLYDIKATPKFDMRTLAYHEAVPGHHFQISIAQEAKDLPFFRRMMPFTAFSEGWALYAENVAWEAGFQKDPFDNLGRLQAELFRSVRLVVDTGMHAKRWTREQAIDYMRSNTGMAEADVVSEIERYIVMPGQACAYKVGMLKIQELRARAQTELGTDFDLRAFHSVVLENGAMPLVVLERVVNDWIGQQQAKKEPAKV